MMESNDVQREKLFSYILLSYQSQDRLVSVIRKLIDRFEQENIPFEIIIIDDGSEDQSFTTAKSLAKEDSRITAYQLSKNYTSPYAIFAGMKMARGHCVSYGSDDFQLPLDCVIQMYRQWEKGDLLVVPYRFSRSDGFWSDLFSNFYYRLMNKYSHINFPRGGADSFLADREIVDILNHIIPINTSPIIEVLQLGYSPFFMGYDRPSVTGKSRWTVRKKLALAMDNFFAASSFPLRLITFLGLITFMFCFLLVWVLVFAKLFSSNKLFGFPIPGWTTTMVTITMFNGLILFSMGIVAEYIWRIYIHIKQRPGYIIKKNRPEPNEKEENKSGEK